jgi:hypothetical protein
VAINCRGWVRRLTQVLSRHEDVILWKQGRISGHNSRVHNGNALHVERLRQMPASFAQYRNLEDQVLPLHSHEVRVQNNCRQMVGYPSTSAFDLASPDFPFTTSTHDLEAGSWSIGLFNSRRWTAQSICGVGMHHELPSCSI